MGYLEIQLIEPAEMLVYFGGNLSWKKKHANLVAKVGEMPIVSTSCFLGSKLAVDGGFES